MLVITQRSRKLSVMMWLIALIALTGCTQRPPLTPEALSTVEDARLYFDTTQTTVPNVKAQYPEDYQIASSQLRVAEESSQQRREAEAVIAAGKSIKASRNILRQFVEHTLLPKAQEVANALKSKQIQDPDSPFGDLLNEVNEILAASERISEKHDVFILEDVQKIADALPLLIETQDTFDKALAETLESDDVSFDRGKYNLNEQGQQRLRDQFVQRFLLNIQEFMPKYPGRTFSIVIKTVGYTDEQSFSLLTKQQLLEKTVATDIVPQHDPEQRQFLNKLLSHLRADSMNAYIKQSIARNLPAESKIEFQPQIVGKGEEIPPNVLSPYPTNDERRRICKVFSYIKVKKGK